MATIVEPGRMQVFAKQLAGKVDRQQVVDWDKREPVLSRLCNFARVVLRRNADFVGLREQVVEHIIERILMPTQDDQGAGPEPAEMEMAR